MKRTHFFILLFTVSLIIFGCGGSSSTPEGIVKDFFQKIEADDADGAIGMLSTQVVTMLGKEKLVKGIHAQSAKIKEKGGIKNIEFNDKKETENEINMKITVTYGNGTTKTDKSKLVKEDGKWKIGISK